MLFKIYPTVRKSSLLRILNLFFPWFTTEQTPLLIVGEGRSGTSWIGQTLGQASNAIYYREPCHPNKMGWGEEIAWSTYLKPGEIDHYFTPSLDAAFKGLITRGQQWSWSKYLRRITPGYKVVIKEVAAFMSLEWIVERYHPDVLVVIRHPCAVALSNKNRNAFVSEQQRIERLLENQLLVDEHLDLKTISVLKQVTTPLEVYAASWAVKNKIFVNAMNRHPQWQVISYEQLCQSPMKTFRSIFERYQLDWNEDVRQFIAQTTTNEVVDPFAISRVTEQQIDKWKTAMTKAEVAEVKNIVEPFELPFYNSESDWAC